MNLRAVVRPGRPLLDFYDPRLIADPYPAYRRLRERAPIWRSPWGERVLTRYVDIAAVLKSPRCGRDFEDKLSSPDRRLAILEEPAYRSVALSMLMRDPPDHTRLRGLAARAFTARRTEAMRERIEARVDALLDDLIPRGRMDVIADFARPLAITVISDILGIPEEDRPRLISSYRFSGWMLDPRPPTAARIAEDNANASSLRAYFEHALQRREREPAGDLISELLQARDDRSGQLSHDELVPNLALLFNAGHATSIDLIGNGLLALFRHPAQWELLKAQPQLAANAVEELLRFDSPVQVGMRKAFEDVALPGGEVVRRWERVVCMLGAANRDPEAHADPDRLDITRTDARPLSFGGGIHHCLGAPLARLEGQIVFRRLTERLPGLTLEDPDHPQWRRTIALRGLARLEARW